MDKGSILKTTIIFFLVMTVITGFIYPLFITGIAQILFPVQANGSLIITPDGIRGSTLVAQEVAGEGFFRPRPSAGSYATVPSGASNSSLSGKALQRQIGERKADWQKRYGPGSTPHDMLYASASGLDPDISVEAALIQAGHVGKARGFTENQISGLIQAIGNMSKTKTLFPSPARVNVMELNRDLEYDPQFKRNK
jgi:potassium-transporting ATPase KdpC subunit